MEDDGEHLLGTLLSQCRSLCDACVEVVACRKNVVTHMKRKHTGIHVSSTNMILEGICKKRSNHEQRLLVTKKAFGGAVHPSHNGGSGMAISAQLLSHFYLVPLTSGRKVHRCVAHDSAAVGSQGTSGGWLSSPLL